MTDQIYCLLSEDDINSIADHVTGRDPRAMQVPNGSVASLIAMLRDAEAERDANVRDVADAVSILEGMLNEGCNYCTTGIDRVRGLLLDAFARPIEELEVREKAPQRARADATGTR